ncbi:hypothetical protein Tco_0003272 [Tanacetum coccineum]
MILKIVLLNIQEKLNHLPNDRQDLVFHTRSHLWDRNPGNQELVWESCSQDRTLSNKDQPLNVQIGMQATITSKKGLYNYLKMVMELEFPAPEISKSCYAWQNVTQTKHKGMADIQPMIQELALLCGRMFPKESDKVEKYAGGLPDMIQGSVMTFKPTKMQDAIEFAVELMDQKIDATKCQKGWLLVRDCRGADVNTNQLSEVSLVGKDYILGWQGHNLNSSVVTELSEQGLYITQFLTWGARLMLFVKKKDGSFVCVSILELEQAEVGNCLSTGTVIILLNKLWVMAYTRLIVVNCVLALISMDCCAYDRGRLKASVLELFIVRHDRLHCCGFLLISLSRGSFDVIVGMDWLSKRKFGIVCHEKVVRIPLEGDEILRVHGERTQGVVKTLMNTKEGESKLSDLVPGATPVAKSPYCLASLEMQELSEQLQELQDEGSEELGSTYDTIRDMIILRIGRVKLRRVRAMSMTIQSSVKDKILATSSETSKVENTPAEMLRDLDQQMEKRADDGKANVVTDALSRKERVKPRRVRAMAMTIQYGVRGMILAAQSEAFKQENGMMRTIVMDEAHASRRKPLEFEVGDRVMLKVSPWKGVIRFGKKGKLAPRYVGPFEILERIGPVAYRLRLPED